MRLPRIVSLSSIVSSRSFVGPLAASLLASGASLILGASSAHAASGSAPTIAPAPADLKAPAAVKVDDKKTDAKTDDKKPEHHHAKPEKKHPRTAHIDTGKAHKGSAKVEPKKVEDKGGPTIEPPKSELKIDDQKADKKADKKAGPLPDLPPQELTGSLPQAKLADKKAKHDDAPALKDGKAHAHDGASKGDTKIEPKAKAGDSLKASDKLGHLGKSGAKSDAVASASAGDFVTTPSAAGAHKKSSAKLKPCLHPAVSFTRLGQPSDVSFPLTTCAGAAAPGAVEHLSVLARPYDRFASEPTRMTRAMAREDASERPTHAFHVEHRVADIENRQIDSGLVSRLQAIADKFPGRTITVVSGIRPQSKGSPHAAARAFDLRIDGVTNESLVAFCKTLQDTGCGYYPNSSFIHVDVRPAGTGHVYWIDVSGPGQAPHYVKQWPLPKGETTPITAETPSETATAKTDDAKVEASAPTSPTTFEETPRSAPAPVGDKSLEVAPTIDDKTIGAQHDETHAGE